MLKMLIEEHNLRPDGQCYLLLNCYLICFQNVKMNLKVFSSVRGNFCVVPLISKKSMEQ